MENKKTKSYSKLALARRIIQAAAFVLFPGLFISTFSALKSIYTAIIGGTFSMAANAGDLVLTISMLLITVLTGRFFCGFLCSFGALGDAIWWLGKKLKIRRPQISEKMDRMLKYVKFIVLGGIVLLVWTLGVSLLSGTANPWTVFGMYATYKGWADLSALLSVGALLLLLIGIGSLYIERFFCRYLCPLGAVFTIVSRIRLFKIRKPTPYCGNCRACTKHCSMGIPLYGMDVVKDGECIDCMQCVEICPKDNVKTNPKPAIAAAAAVVAMSGMYFVGNLADSAASAQSAVAAVQLSSSSTTSAGQYVDGVYTGSAAGYHGTTTVQVTVSGGLITDITVLSSGDDAQFLTRAENGVISDILSTQSVAVDTVSGATYSSNGIIGAVTDALSSALTGTTSTQTVSSSETTTASGSTTTATSDTSTASTTQTTTSTAATTSSDGTITLADGTYTGTGTGFRGETSVTVTVEDGTITSIVVNSYSDDERYFTRAESTVISEILTNQTPDVDAVSGATYSSNGIMEAVANALNLEYTSTVTTNGGQQNGHGHH